MPIIRVTPETLPSYLPDFPEPIHRIGEIAHKADMIRALLLRERGGMWLDADAVVLRDLNPFLDHRDRHEFVGFNGVEPPAQGEAVVRVNCFASRPKGWIVSEWARLQQAKFLRTTFERTEVGSDILHPPCLARPDLAAILPFDLICPIPWYAVDRFSSRRFRTRELAHILKHCSVVMMSNRTLDSRGRRSTAGRSRRSPPTPRPWPTSSVGPSTAATPPRRGWDGCGTG